VSDPGRERLVERLLAHLENNGDDERLRELAAGIRSGSAGWAGSLTAPAYAEALKPGLNGFARWYDHLSDTERAEQAGRCRSTVDDLNRDRPPGD
jgi:hypothetical protein